MKEYTDLHGFKLVKTTDCPEQSAVLVEYRHERTAAPLYYLDRPDKNMTFAIGFRTVPTDDTGVFHILEHSVLCGSEKFPVKDPFSELLKGSISTFLNAFTYGDRTVYPVSSLNKKAFLDLVNVYLDAVLHPLALTNRNVFLQEGHRLELTDDGRLERNGIVYNEMRGAYSSPDELEGYYEGRLAFAGGCFGFDSGGNPECIPQLTYESFVEAHGKYYHPTNSILFLDGEVELEPVLALIDSYLCEYEMGECFTEIPIGGDVVTEPLTVDYPVATPEEEKDKTRITLVRRFGSHEDRAGYLAVALAAEAISDGNSSPLKKRILESGLCQNFSFYPVSGMKYPTFVTKFTDVKDGCEQELTELYKKALSDILSKGIDKEAILAALNSTEFSLREADYGSYPRGMIYMSCVMESAVCGEYPTEGLKYNELFTFLREKLDTPYYVEALREVFSGEREATLVLCPSATAQAEEEARERSRMAELLAAMSDAERLKIKEDNRALALWQSTPDSEEDIAKLPALSISDLTGVPENVPTDIYCESGVEVILHPIPANGITYLYLLFDVSDLPTEDMSALSLMSLCTSEFDTDEYSAADFLTKIKKNIGGISASVLPVKKNGKARLYFQIGLSVLDRSKDAALDILGEFLYTRKYEDAEVMQRRLSQLLSRRRESLLSNAASVCIARGAAMFDSFEAVKEHISGLSFTYYLKRAEQSSPSLLLDKFKELTDGYLTRSRLIVAITGERDRDFAYAAISKVREGGTPPGVCSVKPLERRNEGISIAASVSYAAATTNLITEGKSAYHGSLSTLGTILDFELLWNEIRVKGGAYGTGFVCRANSGTMGYYSYRDPSPERSVRVYGEITEDLRSFLLDEPDLTKYVIGTVGAMETVSTPRSAGSNATIHYLSGKSYEDIIRVREESIATTASDLLRAADMIDRAMQSAVVTVAGTKEKLLAMQLDEIIEI